MAINSLQDLIAQFHGNFNLLPKQDAAAAAGAAAAAAAAKPPVAPPSGTDLSSGDKVTLSAEALAYQKAHTLASGKFVNPNVFDDFMGALDAADGQGDDSQDDGISSLIDALHPKAADPTATDGTPSAADLAAVLNKLKGFLG